jgi:hypothetical protein
MDRSKLRRKQTENTIYTKSLLTRNILLPMINVGKNLPSTIEKYMSLNFEGKCIVEGYVEPKSCKIITYSSGLIKGTNIAFEVVFECNICCPVEGMLIQCIAKNITKAGIRGESSSETPSPFIVFVTRDHHYMIDYFQTVKENDKFVARVIGQRFELNDKYISIIAELVEPKKDYTKTKTPILKISSDDV